MPATNRAGGPHARSCLVSCPSASHRPTVKRDYVDGAELRDAESVLAQLSGWIEDYNTRAPHPALGMRNPVDYRAATTLSSSR
jgi:transposase InsO family protein